MLPSEVSVLAETRDGEPLSLLLDLKRNSRDQLDVRVAAGAQIYDGRRVWEIVTDEPGVVDRVTGDRVRFAVAPGARLLALFQRHVWWSEESGRHACDMRDGRCRVAEVPPLPLDHPGPGAGFRVALADGTLRLFLPQDSAAEGITLARDVSRLLGVYWVRAQTGEADTVVNRTFRGRARIHALPRAVTADGALEDWPDAAPLVVEAPWQLQAGADGWKGERDASFSVAAAWTPEQVCLAGRVRDDARGAGDALTIRLDAVTLEVPLEGPTPAGAVVDQGWLGAAFEVCVPSSSLRASARLALSLSLTDVDPGEPTTVLASAPEVGGAPLGELVLDAPE